MYSDLKIVTGSSNPDLAKAICNHLGCQLTPTLATTFSDGELRIEIGDNVRGDDVFVVQPTCPPTINRNLVQLCLMLDALKRASAGRITAVIPYYGYARQDRKVSPRAPISAKMVADFISVAGAERVVTIDLHAGQIQGYFDCPVDNLFAVPVMLESLRRLHDDNIVIVSPDAGGVERARAYAKRLNAPLAIVDKRRDKPNQAQAMHVIGDVKGRLAIVVDDMIDTAGTLCAGADVLLKNGAIDAKLWSPFFLYSASAMSESAELRINGKYFSAAFTPWISYASHAVCSSTSLLTNGSSSVILFPFLILSKNSSSITL